MSQKYLKNILGFKLFSQHIFNKMISSDNFNFKSLQNIEKPGSAHLLLKKIQQGVSVKFNLFPKRFNYSNYSIIFNFNIQYSLDYIKCFMPCILNTMRHNIFPDILNKGVYRILVILTQNAYMYTPIFQYAQYTPVFVRILPTYNFLFVFSYVLCRVTVEKYKWICIVPSLPSKEVTRLSKNELYLKGCKKWKNAKDAKIGMTEDGRFLKF